MVVGSGSVNQTSGWFQNGTTAHLLASADMDNAFLNWTIDNENSSSNPLAVTMNSNHTVIAYLTSYKYLTTTSDQSILGQIVNFKPFWADLILVIALVCYLCYYSITNNLKRKGGH